MAIGHLSLFSMLKTRMHWQQARQDVLSQNVANIDTPGFKPTDLKPPGFASGSDGPGGVLRMVETSPLDIHQPTGAAGQFAQVPLQDASLEDQLMQVSQNATDFRLVSSLYSAGLSLIRSAAGS